MSVASHDTTSSLLAATQAHPAPAGQVPEFPVVARGYHRQEVEEWARGVLREVEVLTGKVASFAGKAAGSPEGQKLIADLLQIAADELTGQKAAAEEEVRQMLAGAREQSDAILADARQQADQVNASATSQAASLVSNARADAKQTTDDAAAHAAAVHEAAGARLARLVQIHEDGLARLAQIHEVSGQILAAEDQRGSLGDEVARVLSPPPQSARPY